MYDLLIIGGGPAGYVAAERAAHKGLKVILFEKSSLGGVCLNEGCIPTKTMLYSAKVYENTLQSSKYGIYNENARIDYSKIIARKNKVIKKLVAGVEQKMKTPQITVIKSEATIVGRHANGIEVACCDQTYTGSNLLICTGSEAFIPPISGIDQIGDTILTNREILNLKEQPNSLVVIGGGVIGMEFASFFNSLGTKVTVIEMQSEILSGLDSEIAIQMREIFSKKGIEFHLNATVKGIESNKLTYEKDGQTHCVETEKILLSVGRKPVIKGYGLENLNIEFHKVGIKVDEQMRTNVKNVFAAGDVTGFSLLAHTASREAEVAINTIVGNTDQMLYNAIPSVVYTNPEVAGVGETEESAKAKGLSFKVAKLPMAYSGRFVAENEGGTGICKVLIETTEEKVIGVHMLGNPCSEIIYGACIAIEQKMTLSQLQKVIFPHPTVSEIFKETIFSF